MANNTPVKDDPEQLEHANKLWDNFIQGSKISIVLIVIIVALLAIFFVPTGA